MYGYINICARKLLAHTKIHISASLFGWEREGWGRQEKHSMWVIHIHIKHTHKTHRHTRMHIFRHGETIYFSSSNCPRSPCIFNPCPQSIENCPATPIPDTQTNYYRRHYWFSNLKENCCSYIRPTQSWASLFLSFVLLFVSLQCCCLWCCWFRFRLVFILSWATFVMPCVNWPQLDFSHNSFKILAEVTRFSFFLNIFFVHYMIYIYFIFPFFSFSNSFLRHLLFFLLSSDIFISFISLFLYIFKFSFVSAFLFSWFGSSYFLFLMI